MDQLYLHKNLVLLLLSVYFTRIMKGVCRKGLYFFVDMDFKTISE